MKGVVEKKSQKKRREDQTVRSLCWCDEGPGAMGSWAYTVDTAGRLKPFTGPLFKAKEGNTEGYSHLI